MNYYSSETLWNFHYETFTMKLSLWNFTNPVLTTWQNVSELVIEFIEVVHGFTFQLLWNGRLSLEALKDTLPIRMYYASYVYYHYCYHYCYYYYCYYYAKFGLIIISPPRRSRSTRSREGFHPQVLSSKKTYSTSSDLHRDKVLSWLPTSHLEVYVAYNFWPSL